MDDHTARSSGSFGRELGPFVLKYGNEPDEVEVVVLMTCLLTDLGLKGVVNLDAIIHAAKDKGLGLCPSDSILGEQLLDKLVAQNEPPGRWLMGMEALLDARDQPYIHALQWLASSEIRRSQTGEVLNPDEGAWRLTTVWATPASFWPATTRFVFCRPI